MRKTITSSILIAILSISAIAHADVFNMDPGLKSLETVTVGDPGNASDTGNIWAPYIGSVGYIFNIGKYEVTASQYTEFLNAVAKTDTYGLYNNNMASTSSGCGISRNGAPGSYSYSVDTAFVNRPVNYVSFWDACRFTNWLGNGQLTGAQNASTTERGAYKLDGYNGTDGRTIQREAGWKWAVTSEDEWYKAAYYKGDSANAGYWPYATKSDTAPDRNMTDASGNNANIYIYMGFGTFPIDSGKFTTVVGEFQNSASAYGTFDQCGNVWEWNDAIVASDSTRAYRGLRGQSYGDGITDRSGAYRNNYDPKCEFGIVGFRVSAAVIDPTYGISNKAAYHSIISASAIKCNFKVWGKVKLLVSGNSFTVDDGSGALVTVVAPGFSGIANGDYASASGKFSAEGSNRVMNALARDVVKLR